MQTRASQKGFTLLEVLVAFVIAALAVGVLYQGALGGLLSARVATQYEEATARARSRLAAIGHGSALIAGEQSGDDGGGFRWRTKVAIAAVAARAETQAQQGPVPGPVPALYDISVVIAWGDARSVQLDSRRVGFTAPAGP